MDSNKIHLPNPKATYLPTLYGKAVDAEEEHSILNDVWAAEAVKRLDFDFSRLPVVQGDAKVTLPWRAKQLDGWAREFLTANAEATVLNLGCGLDTRVFRIDPSPTVHWYDVDFPEVVPSLIHSKAQGWLYYHVFDKWQWYRDAMSHFRFEF